jgi:hypothetical protein
MYKEITNPSERIIDLRNKINEAEGTFQLLLNITTVHLVH